MLSNTTYNNYDGDVGGFDMDAAVFYPDAPSYPPITPVKPRATPYVDDPDECTINFRTGTIQCISNQSHGELRARPVVTFPQLGLQAAAPVGPGPVGMGMVGLPVSLPPYPNYVYGGSVVAGPPDSPLNRILQRSPAGPWKLVGAAISDHPHTTAPRDRTMMVYAQMVDSGRDRYNYRVVDPNNVPLDIDTKVHWKNDGDRLRVPGYPGDYVLQLYYNYR